MRTSPLIALVTSVALALVSFSVISSSSAKPAVFAESENTFEFTNNETEDAYDLHIHWSRAVTVKDVKPFKKKEGSGTNTTDFSNGTVEKTKSASVTVSWDGSSEAKVKEWWWTRKNGKPLGEKKTGNPTTGAIKSRVVSNGGLYTATFDTMHGQVRVHLPDDMAAGDTISGTVVAEPKGQTDEERRKNEAELTGYVIDITPPKTTDGTQGPNTTIPVSTTPKIVTITLPQVSSSSSSALGIGLRNVSGTSSTGGPRTVPIEMIHLSLHSVEPIKVYNVPKIGQQGRPVEIIGPFDGNAENTKVMYGPPGSTVQDFEKNTEHVSGGFGLIRPFAESRRKLIFEMPRNLYGPVEIYIEARMIAATTSLIRDIGVDLSALKTNLRSNERTTLTVKVFGLAGITENVPLHLDATGSIAMDGGNFQNLLIRPSDVSAGGVYTTTRGITGQQAGAFTCTATVITKPFDIVMRDPPTGSSLLLNSFTGDYVFCMPKLKSSGTGQVTGQGCTVNLEDKKKEAAITVSVDRCKQTANAMVQTFDAATQPIRIKQYYNPLGRPAPPVQDVSAFATCP